MASVTITNLGGSIRLQDVRFYPDVTDVEILKDGLVLTQFGDICRIRFTNGIAFDATFDEYEIIGFGGSIIPTDAQSCYDAIWAVLADYGNTSSGDCCACEDSGYRLLEDGSLRLLEEGCVRITEEGGDSPSVLTKNSVTGDGSLGTEIELVNDQLSPGVRKIYSTDDSGVKGWNEFGLTNIYVNFDVGATLSFDITIDIDTQGVYSNASFIAPMSSATYEINATPLALPFTLSIGDILTIIPNAEGSIKLSGNV